MLFTILLVIFNIAYAYAITVNVKDQGAKGDGVTDDTRAFDRSVEMVCERGGVLFVPNGNYRLNGLTRRRSGVNGNGYIFLMLNSLEWRMEKDAILLFENNFQGFRFRSLTDPNAKTITKLSLIINGGKVLGRDIKSKGKGNPEKWAFVGEYLKSMSVQNLEIENLFASAGVASYHNDFVSVINCKLKNVTGNSGDLMDNHGDGIYIGWTSKYLIKGNSVLNDVTTRRLGRIGICIEYEKSKNGTVEKTLSAGMIGVYT
nr:glycoside hydrolase family 55 protein [Niabella hibiscisoli]